MKTNQKGFSVVEILIVIVVVGLIGTVGWFVYGSQKNRTSNVSTNTQTNQEPSNQENVLSEFIEYENEEFGFEFSYPKSWGEDVAIEPSYIKSKSGKAYSIVIGSNDKLVAGFKTKDWVALDSNDNSWAAGFVVYGDCEVGPKAKNVVELHRSDEACVVVRGTEVTGQGSYDGKTAQIFLEKKFNDDSPYAGVEFQHAPMSVDDFSDNTLKSAYEKEITDGFLKIAKTFKEI